MCAIVVGYEVFLEDDQVPLNLAEMVRDAVALLNKRHGLNFRLFVAGDTTDTGVGDASAMVVGRAAVSSDCYEPPVRFEAAAVRKAAEDFPDLPDKYWHEMGIELGVETRGTEEAKPFLLSWGPLCYGAVCVGVSMNQDERDQAKYKYMANQDMYQEWTSEGLDGQTVRFTHPKGYERSMTVEFSDICEVDMSEEAVESFFAQIPDHEDPSLFLLCRYD